MANPPDAHLLSHDLLVWHRYDPSVKADLYASALATHSGVYLIDPTLPTPETLPEFLGTRPVSGIIVTNENHFRASAKFSRVHSAPIHHHPEVPLPGGAIPSRLVEDGERLGSDLEVLALPGAPAGEIALHWSTEGGTLILGDALINMEAHGFAFLPAKYCRDHDQMRQSLRRLLDYRFERILFAHGAPIVTRARPRLEALLA